MQNEKEIKPDYYDTFSCIADKCPFTCCQEWKIAVDDETNKKWEKLNITGQKNDWISKTTIFKEGSRVVELNSEKKCPFLDKNKLCKLVINYGEGVLSKTCATFPRQIHTYESENRKEYSLVSCCPAVIDIWKELEKITFTNELAQSGDNILFQLRKFMIDRIQDEKYSISKSMMIIFYTLLSVYQEPCSETEKIQALQKYGNAAVLQELSSTIDEMKFCDEDTFTERNELFLDLAENYRKEDLYTKHLEQIATLAETFSEGKTCAKKSQEEFEKVLSGYDRLFRNYLVSEFFTNSCMPDSDMESMIVMFQWIAMEYITIRHALFLRWQVENKNELSYTTVRDYIVLLSRMTGYDQEDIYEYMKNSFQSLTWDWGYLALIVGEAL